MSSPSDTPTSGTPVQATTSSPVVATTPTSSSPTPTASPTSTTPAATVESSAAQSSSPAVQTTSPSQGASALPSASSGSSTAATPASTTSVFTSQVATTISTTDASGSVVYVTSTVPEVFTTSISTTGSSSGGSNSHTGVIVGAVVGGVVGLAILVFLAFCIRRRSRRDDFDGNFDPDRVIGHAEGGTGGALPNVDLADEVTPFPRPHADQGSMRQYGDSPYLALPSSVTSGQTGSDFYAPGAGSPTFDAQPRQYMNAGFGPPRSEAHVSPVDIYGGGSGDWNSRSGGSPPPSTVSYHTSSSNRGAKEREAMGRSRQGTGLGLATQPETAEGSGDIVVHQDAGRAPIEEHAPPPREIPPAYESIRQD